MIQKIEKQYNVVGNNLHSSSSLNVEATLDEIISVLNLLTEEKEEICGHVENDAVVGITLCGEKRPCRFHTPQEEKGEAWENRLRDLKDYDDGYYTTDLIEFIKGEIDKARQEERGQTINFIGKFYPECTDLIESIKVLPVSAITKQ